jgi:hypothetical protein
MSAHSTGLSRFGRLPVAQARSGLGRVSLYKLAASHRGLFRKFGAATIVDLEMLDEILAALPAAELTDSGDPNEANAAI